MFEAMASGLPAILASTVGANELVTPDCGVVLPDPNNVSALASAMNMLASDPQRREQMGRSARAVAERHTWGKMADNCVSLYQEIAARRGA